MKKKGKSKPRPQAASAPKTTFWKGLVVGTLMASSAVYFFPRLTGNDPQKGSAAEDSSAPDSNAAANETKPPKAKTVQLPDNSPKPKAPPSASHSSAPPPRTQMPTTPAAPQDPATGPRPKNAPVLTLFNTPIHALTPALRLGLGDSYADSSQWKKTDSLGYNAFASVTTSSPVASNNGPVGNSVTCLIESNRPDQVENLLVVANVFNRQGEPETLEKFRQVCRAYLSETGCPVTREFVDAIGTTGMATQTAAASYALKRIDLRPAYRWELTITAK